MCKCPAPPRLMGSLPHRCISFSLPSFLYSVRLSPDKPFPTSGPLSLVLELGSVDSTWLMNAPASGSKLTPGKPQGQCLVVRFRVFGLSSWIGTMRLSGFPAPQFASLAFLPTGSSFRLIMSIEDFEEVGMVASEGACPRSSQRTSQSCAPVRVHGRLNVHLDGHDLPGLQGAHSNNTPETCARGQGVPCGGLSGQPSVLLHAALFITHMHKIANTFCSSLIFIIPRSLPRIKSIF